MRIVVLLLAGLVLAACGTSEQQAGQGTTVDGWSVYPTTDAAPESDAPPGCDPPSRFNGTHADNHARSCLVCRTRGPEEVASEYQIADSEEIAIAEAYAAKASTVELRSAVREGCARGFELSR